MPLQNHSFVLSLNFFSFLCFMYNVFYTLLVYAGKIMKPLFITITLIKSSAQGGSDFPLRVVFSF